jgi:hypothetical protein
MLQASVKLTVGWNTLYLAAPKQLSHCEMSCDTEFLSPTIRRSDVLKVHGSAWLELFISATATCVIVALLLIP